MTKDKVIHVVFPVPTLEIVDEREITGRGRVFTLERAPEGVTDLSTLRGRHYMIFDKAKDQLVEFVITGVETFCDLNANFRVDRPLGILVKEV